MQDIKKLQKAKVKDNLFIHRVRVGSRARAWCRRGHSFAFREFVAKLVKSRVIVKDLHREQCEIGAPRLRAY